MTKQEKAVVDSVYEALSTKWTDEMIDNLLSRLEAFLLDKDLAPWEDGGLDDSKE